VLPITQAAAGWLLFLAAFAVVAAGLVLRRLVRGRRETAAVRRVVHVFRETALAQLLFGRMDSDMLSDDELDNVTLMPAIVVAGVLFVGAIALLGTDSFQIHFTLFRLP
jgi:hypothetical protein